MVPTQSVLEGSVLEVVVPRDMSLGEEERVG
jgi:hypothetical protein